MSTADRKTVTELFENYAASGSSNTTGPPTASFSAAQKQQLFLKYFDKLLGTRSFIPPLPKVDYHFSNFLKFWHHLESDLALWGQLTRKRTMTLTVERAGIKLQRTLNQNTTGN
ncbi:unnamed protein product, partial [Amoebophrya sp. A120]|eukprot:GSA120T00014766001.1